VAIRAAMPPVAVPVRRAAAAAALGALARMQIPPQAPAMAAMVI